MEAISNITFDKQTSRNMQSKLLPSQMQGLFSQMQFSLGVNQ